MIFFKKNLLIGTFTCPLIFSEKLDNAESVWRTLLSTMPRKYMNLPYSIHKTWTNFWQPTKYFCKKSYRSWQLTSLRFFWHLLRPNWSIIRGAVSLWSMFENREIALIEGKCRRFRNSSECSNTYSAAKNWPIWTQKVPKEA